MRRKFLSILALVFVFITCAFVSACEGKYDKMSFKVYYAYSEDADEWFNANDGIIVNYGSNKKGELIFDNGEGKIYLKVELKNVKSQNVDSITVASEQSANLNFSSTKVKPNKVFSISINGNVNTRLKFYENNSKKSKTINFNVYRSLEGIEVNNTIKPAVQVGTSLNLQQVKNLIYLPVNRLNQSLTNQTGVEYSIDSIGAYITQNEDGYLAKYTQAQSQNFVTINNGVLNIINDSFLNSDAYIVRVKATSIYHNGAEDEQDVISALFDVYVVEDIHSFSSTLSFVNADETIGKEVESIDLYSGNLNFSSSLVCVDNSEFASIYKNPRNTIDGQVYAKLVIKVLNENTNAYEAINFEDVSSLDAVSGLIVTKENALNGEDVYKFFVEDWTNKQNFVKFTYEYDGLNFSASTSPVIEKDVVVNKGLLPNAITINENISKIDIYSTSNTSYKGVAINLKVVPSDSNNEKIRISGDLSSFILSNSKGVLTSNIVNSNSTIYVKFKANSNIESAKLIFETLKTPNVFNGEIPQTEYVSKELTVANRVTADAIEIVANENGDEFAPNTAVLLNAANTSSMFVKVVYNGNIDESTISLTSSNEGIRFTNGLSSITIDQFNKVASRQSIYDDNNEFIGRYNIYKVDFQPVGDLRENTSTVKIVAGDESVGVSKNVTVKSVHIMNNTDFTVLTTTNSGIKDFSDANSFKFAVANGTLAEFEVLDGNGYSNTIESIELIKNGIGDTTKYTTSLNTVIMPNNLFSVNVFGNKTQVMSLKVYYYKQSGDIIELGSETKTIQIAAYYPISFVNLSTTKNKLAAYSGYDETNIYYSISSLATLSDKIYFTDKEIDDDINQLELSLDGFDLNLYALKIKCNNQELEGGSKLGLGATYPINIKMIQEIESTSLKIKVSALCFGEETGVFDELVIKFVQIDQADRIIIYGENIVKYTDDNSEIQLSFLNVDGNYVEKNANIVLEYSSEESENLIRIPNAEQALDYKIYQYVLNENGEPTYKDGSAVLNSASKNILNVKLSNNKLTVGAYEDFGGGLFKLEFFTPYGKSISIDVRVSDGVVQSYILTSVSEFLAINNNLDKSFVLGSNLTINISKENYPIGFKNSSITPFSGELRGTLVSNAGGTKHEHRYTLNVYIENSVTSPEYGQVAGLFTMLRGAQIYDLDLNIEFANSFESSLIGICVGGIAGVIDHDSAIENVNINIATPNAIKFTNATEGEINFGCVVGKNFGTIKNVIVNSTRELKIEKTDSESEQSFNFGMIAGTNEENAEISGNYEDLKNLVFDVIANVSVTSGDAGLNIAGVAGLNKGLINHILVGGEIAILTSTAKGSLGGVAGTTTGSIDHCAALSLNLKGASEVCVGGIAGIENNATINDVKFISAVTSFNFGTKLGAIDGNKIAGIVAKAVNGNIEKASVESFVKTVEVENTTSTFNTLNGTIVAGLVAEADSVNISLSFVHANLKGSNVYVTSPNGISETTTYFFGKVNETFKFIARSIEILEGNLNSLENWGNQFSALNSNENWDLDENHNVYVVDDLGFYFPYLVEKVGTDENNNDIFKPLMIISPTDISASLDQPYFVETNSTYVSPFSLKNYNVTETVLINYHYGNGHVQPEHNTYAISDLVNLTVVPEYADAGLRYEIVGSGYRYAYINANNEIVFTAISFANPIIVKCYSVFNPDIAEYVVFYTQAGINKLTLQADALREVQDNGDYTYEIDLYGTNNLLLKMDAENQYNGNNYVSIFSTSGIENNLIVRADAGDIEDYLSLENSNYNNISIQIKEDAEFNDIVSGVITFKLYLNGATYFNSDAYDSLSLTDEEKLIEIGTIGLKVYLHHSATEILLEASDYELPTNSSVSFNATLTTGYVDNISTAQESFVANGNWARNNQNNANRDDITLKFDVVSGQTQVDTLLETNNLTEGAYAELFDYSVSVVAQKDNGKTVGYKYSVNIKLIDKFDYRYITESFKFKVTITAVSDSSIQNELFITFKPTQVSTARISNYNVKSINVHTAYQNLIANDNLESSTISPAGLGSIMYLYVEPAYSNIDEIKLTSSSLYVPSLGKNVTLKFTQLIYNEHINEFETLYGSNENNQVGESIILAKMSRKDNAHIYYDGIIYVYVQLEHFSGLEATITASLDIVSNGVSLPTVKKPLLTTYIPGAEINYNGRKIETTENEYLIQTGTIGNAQIKVYGYQFNSNPTINLSWNLLTQNDDLKYRDIAILNEVDEIVEHFNNGETLWYIDEDYVYHKTNFAIDGVATYYSINTRYIVDKNGNVYDVRNYVSAYINSDYSNVSYNAIDDSYTMGLTFNVAEDIPAAFNMNASLSLITKDGQLLTSQNKEIVLHPTDYIINSATLSGLVNNTKNVAVHRSADLNFHFATDNENKDDSLDIYKKLAETRVDVESDDYSELYKLFSFVQDGQQRSFASEDVKTYFNLITDTDNYIITLVGAGTLNANIAFRTMYSYQLDKNTNSYELKFNDETGIILPLEFSFRLNIFVNEVEDEPEAIETVDQMFNADGTTKLVAGGHYILMNDIIVENVVPIDVAIGSLDGNNKVITIKNFVVDPQKTNYGLFDNVGTYTDSNGQTKQTILKNVIVDYSQFSSDGLVLTNNEITTINFGGLVAQNNGALIYNCDVMNLSTQEKTINILVDNNSEAGITFGGLVGVNSGIITNSRVGRASYLKITNNVQGTGTTVYGGPIRFTIGNTTAISDTANGFNAIAGGFVGKNSGIISSSYVVNAGLINYSTSQTSNETAGFVAENTSNISYSYVKAIEDTITRTNSYSTGIGIESKGNGMVAGFAYSNSGNINNSFANTELKTKSAYIAGFVFNNATTGVVSESYAACTMNSGLSGTAADDAEQPFIGLNTNGELLSFGTLENTYYLLKSDSYTNHIELNNADKDLAMGISANSFTDSNNLFGFVFVLSNSKTESDQGIWSYYDTKNERHILPELTNANIVSVSSRYVDDTTGAYLSSKNYEMGSANNPYIIRNVDEYINVFGNVGFTGYARFINNIDFNEDETAVQTRVNYTLGDKDGITTTSVEGNGMTISGIYLDAKSTDNEVGLFGQVESAYIKNLNLEFATPKTNGQYSTTNVMYSGGLAGKINNSVIININLSGTNVTLTGQNFVGGLAGLIEGQSLLFNIKSNLSVVANTTRTNDYLYYREADFNPLLGEYESYLQNLSYAGGLAGVLDLTDRKINSENANISFVEIGDPTLTSSRQAVSIDAEYSGGVAGYASKETKALKLKFNIGENDIIKGNKVAGGLFGVFAGKIDASQVTATETVAYDYDLALGKYAVALSSGNAALDTSKIGNTSLIESHKYAGGLIGIALNATVSSSYAKAGFKNGQVLGGLVGVSIASSVVYSYATPFVNLSTADVLEYGGGLIGAAYGIRQNSPAENAEVRYYENYVVAKAEKSDINTDIQFTFSTLYVEDVGNNATLDFVVAKYSTQTLTSNNNKTLMYVFAGPIDYINAGVENTNKENNSYMNLAKLFSFDNPVEISERSAEFQRVFSGWSAVNYWTLDETKFYPLLLNKKVNSYIQITSAGQLKTYLNANPTGAFMVMEDINFGDELESNWVVSQVFRGMLVGNIEGENKRPKIYGIKLKPNDNGTTGFFMKTSGATISGLEFEWEYLDLGAGTNISNVSTLSCHDESSLFSNIKVTVSNTENGLFKNSANNNIEIAGFGGIVGKGENTNINGCEFVGKVKATIKDTFDESYFGGIAGQIKATATGGEEVSNGAVITNAVVGNGEQDSPVTEFELTINSTKNHIGGVVGYAGSSVVTNSSIGGINYSDINHRQITIKLDFNTGEVTSSNNIGGLIGTSVQTSVYSSDAVTKFKILGGTENVNIAGFVGSIDSADIFTSNTQTEIDLSDLKCSSANLSTGVAIIIGTGSDISQCLFNGAINTEGPTEGINNIYAGGTVAQVSGKLNVNEVMTNADIVVGSISTQTLYTGGQVGFVNGGNVTILNAVTTGRIVPITSDVLNNGISVGGIIGENNGIIAVENSITLTSIIADGVSGAAIAQANINALFGTNAPSSVNNVYYSSDYALFPEGSGVGLNISANELVNDTTYWYKNFTESNTTDGSSWNVKAVGSNYKLPFISTIVEALKVYGVLKDDYSYYTYKNSDFNKITLAQLTPTVLLNGGGFEISEDYVYYLMSPTITENSPITAFSGSLNGVLIGQEHTYLFNNTSSFAEKEEGGSKYQGLVAEILKHSAISNLHIVVADGTTITSSDFAGVIAGLNNGVISNSSVQGHGIKLVGASFGLIAAENNGLMAYTFSTAEITSSSSSTAGLVNTNNGNIMSGFFTGYIGNGEGSTAAGIAVSSSGYIYNIYMAGVVERVTNNSFVAQNTLKGSNNYIDCLANVETVQIETTIGVGADAKTTINLQTISSDKLYTNQSGLLKGNWYTTLSKDAETEKYTVETTSTTFGYNFGYPVYVFNKMVTNDTSNPFAVLQDKEYQGFTGTGATELSNQTDRYNAINGTAGWNQREYNNSYKIPHLGVLKTIGYFEDSDRNFVLIYDIDKEAAWTASDLQGVFVANKNFLRTEVSEASTDHMCKVARLTSGLFAEIKNNAYIADLILGSFDRLNDKNGPLGTTVTGNTIVNNIHFDEDIIIDGDNVGGLFGTIDINTSENADYKLSIFHFVTGSEGNAYSVIGSAEGSAGLIAYKMNQGLLDIDANSELYAKFAGGVNAGGMLAEMSGGRIIGNDVLINIVQQDDALASLGAIVNKTSNETTIEKFKINFTVSESTAIKTNSFGLIATANGTTKLNGCKYSLENGNDRSIEFNGEGKQTYGLIAGVSNDGSEIEVKNFTSNIGTLIFSTTSTESNNNSGVGVLVGKNSGDLSIDITGLEISLNSYNIANLGGIAGYYEGGKFAIKWEETAPTITLNGTDNVGGVFGYCKGEVNSSTFKSKDETAKDLFNIGFITISLEVGVNGPNTFTNIGGLFGVLDVNGELNYITNKNLITLKESENVSGSAVAYNVGGVAGLFKGTKATAISNEANIQSLGVGADVIANSADGVKLYIKGMNVGGVFGKVENSAILTELSNTAMIQGYQNVGGLIGYVNTATTITGSLKTSQEYEELADKYNYEKIDGTELYHKNSVELMASGAVNVGGLVGYAGNSVRIEKFYADAKDNEKVFGNVNVGGVVGLSNGATINNNYIESANVKGVYYSYIYKVVKTLDSTVFIPTSVGGMVGTSVSSTITNNVLSSIKLSSAEEGIEGGTVISTISNYMANAAMGSGNNFIGNFIGSALYTLDNSISQNNRNLGFNDISTGFGGFIGTTDVNTLKSGETDKVKSNTIYSMNINAQLGVNVGTFYGSVADGIDGINIPKLIAKNGNRANVSIDGAYNVGGLVGYIGGAVSNVKNSLLQGEATINVQGNGSTAIYVGGLFGKISGSVLNVELLANQHLNIIINTNNSYYIGGLVGRWETAGETFSGNVGTLVNAETSVFSNQQITTSEITHVNSAINFGGLIGMVKVTSYNNSYGININVSGTHAYPFTVNTIENGDYYDGPSLFDSNELNFEIYLSAQAYYVNLDTFNIAASSNKAWYDNDHDENPTRPNDFTWGWAKEYTGFKKMQRCIPQSQNNGAEWDSIAAVYDAYHITNVGTIGNLGLSGQSLKNNKNEDTTFDDGHICYTVYEEEDENPTLYSSVGIATIIIGENTENGKLAAGTNGKIVKYVTPVDDDANAWDWIGGFIIGSEPDQQYYISANKSPQLKGLTYFDTTATYTTINNGSASYKADGKTTAELVYMVSNYIPDAKENRNAYFMFTTIYDRLKPNSGSVFEVNGYTTSGLAKDHLPDEGKTTFEWISLVTSVVITIVLTVATWGTATLVDNAVVMGLKAAQAASKLAKTLQILKFAKTTFMVITATLALSYFSKQNQAGVLSKDTFLNQKDTGYGLLSETYIRRIQYTTDGDRFILSDNAERTIVVDDNFYSFYSYVRPSDYTTAYYYGIDITAPENANKKTATTYFKRGDITLIKLSELINDSRFTEYLEVENGDADADTNLYTIVGDKAYLIYKHYEYSDGAYYVSTMASDVVDIRVQKFISSEKQNANAVGTNGLNYVYGHYNGEVYKIGLDSTHSDYTSNNLTYESGKYKVNGTEIKDQTIATIEKTIYFDSTYRDRRENGPDNKYELFGYNYIGGAYYTVDGQYFTDAPKYAKFTKVDSQPTNGKENVDWIKIKFYENVTRSGTDEYGEPYEYQEKEYTYVYYSFNGLGTNDNVYSVYSEYESKNYPNTINVAVYVTGFNNPYIINSASAVRDSSYNNGAEWEYYYYAASANANNSIEHKATYYYFEGGYKYNLLSKDDIWFAVSESRYETSGIYYVEDEANTIKSYKDILYDKDNNYQLRENPNFDNLESQYETKTVNGETCYFFKNKYTFGENNNYTSVIIKKTGGYEVYELADETFKVKDGLLYQQFLTFNEATGFKNNKYLANPNYELYTRFKYNDNNLVYGKEDWDDRLNGKTLEGKWVKADIIEKSNDGNYGFTQTDYRLIPTIENQSYEPNGSPTYLVERVQVVIGGGGVLISQYVNGSWGDSSQMNSGTVNIN